MDSRENRLPPPVLSLPSLAGLLSRLFTLGDTVLTNSELLILVNCVIEIEGRAKHNFPCLMELNSLKRKLEKEILFLEENVSLDPTSTPCEEGYQGKAPEPQKKIIAKLRG